MMRKQKGKEPEIVNKIKDAVRIAKEVVENEPEPYRTEAFRVVLGTLLESTGTSASVDEVETPKVDRRERPGTDGLEKLASACSISRHQLEDVVDTRDGVVSFLVHLDGTAGLREEQIVASQCILVTYHVALGKEWVGAATLAEAIRNAGMSSNNLSRNLSARPDLFRKHGKKRSTEYKLTETAKKVALLTIKALSEGKGQKVLEAARGEAKTE